MTTPDYLQRILGARVYDVAIESPLELAPNLSKRLHNRLLLKREDLQPVFSFKLRGAYNKMVRLPRAVLARGVIAASAGNHAQGVALAAQRLHCKATIVMPVTTPQIKIEAVRARGAQVVLHGDSYDEAYTHTKQLAAKHRLTLVHPYDDPDVIAGQGTIGMEILRQHAEPIHAIFVPIGGGGLIAGIAAWFEGRSRVVALEPELAPTLFRAREAGCPVDVAVSGIAADSLGARRIGGIAWEITQRHVKESLLVSDDAIRQAQLTLWREFKLAVEPAAALGLAALQTGAVTATGSVCLVLCGANVDPATLG